MSTDTRLVAIGAEVVANEYGVSMAYIRNSYKRALPLGELRERIDSLLRDHEHQVCEAATGDAQWPSIGGTTDAVLRVILGEEVTM